VVAEEAPRVVGPGPGEGAAAELPREVAERKRGRVAIRAGSHDRLLRPGFPVLVGRIRFVPIAGEAFESDLAAAVEAEQHDRTRRGAVEELLEP
jgi:hypothetical protein